MNNTNKYYIDIEFSDHTHRATVTSYGQISRFVSDKKRPFRIGTVALVEGKFEDWLLKELNTLRTFGYFRKRGYSLLA